MPAARARLRSSSVVSVVTATAGSVAPCARTVRTRSWPLAPRDDKSLRRTRGFERSSAASASAAESDGRHLGALLLQDLAGGVAQAVVLIDDENADPGEQTPGIQNLAGHRELDRERGAGLLPRTLRVHATPVRFDQRLDDRQSDPQLPESVGSRVTGRPELLEHLVQDFRRDVRQSRDGRHVGRLLEDSGQELGGDPRPVVDHPESGRCRWRAPG